MKLSQPLSGGYTVALIIALVACGSGSGSSPDTSPAVAKNPARATSPACASGSGFALSLVSDIGGQPTPVRAAQWLARHGGVPGIPLAGWREIRRQAGSAIVVSGPVTVHVIQGPDLTWQVDSGERCAA
jgi:hypothetical protein